MPVGLSNEGATGYLNVALQCLYHIPALRDAVLSLPLDSSSDPCRCPPLALQRLFARMQASPPGATISTKEMTQSLGWKLTEVNTADDAFYMFNALLQLLTFTFKAVNRPDIVEQLFSFTVTRKDTWVRPRPASHTAAGSMEQDIPHPRSDANAEGLTPAASSSSSSNSSGSRDLGVAPGFAHAPAVSSEEVDSMGGTPRPVDSPTTGRGEGNVVTSRTHHQTMTNFSFQYLTMEIVDGPLDTAAPPARLTNLQECLEDYFESTFEWFGADEVKNGGEWSAFYFSKSPKVLPIQLKRFKYDLDKEDFVYLKHKVEFPEQLDLSSYCFCPPGASKVASPAAAGKATEPDVAGSGAEAAAEAAAGEAPSSGVAGGAETAAAEAAGAAWRPAMAGRAEGAAAVLGEASGLGVAGGADTAEAATYGAAEPAIIVAPEAQGVGSAAAAAAGGAGEQLEPYDVRAELQESGCHHHQQQELQQQQQEQGQGQELQQQLRAVAALASLPPHAPPHISNTTRSSGSRGSSSFSQQLLLRELTGRKRPVLYRLVGVVSLVSQPGRELRRWCAYIKAPEAAPKPALDEQEGPLQNADPSARLSAGVHEAPGSVPSTVDPLLPVGRDRGTARPTIQAPPAAAAAVTSFSSSSSAAAAAGGGGGGAVEAASAAMPGSAVSKQHHGPSASTRKQEQQQQQQQRHSPAGSYYRVMNEHVRVVPSTEALDEQYAVPAPTTSAAGGGACGVDRIFLTAHSYRASGREEDSLAYMLLYVAVDAWEEVMGGTTVVPQGAVQEPATSPAVPGAVSTAAAALAGGVQTAVEVSPASSQTAAAGVEPAMSEPAPAPAPGAELAPATTTAATRAGGVQTAVEEASPLPPSQAARAAAAAGVQTAVEGAFPWPPPPFPPSAAARAAAAAGEAGALEPTAVAGGAVGAGREAAAAGAGGAVDLSAAFQALHTQYVRWYGRGRAPAHGLLNFIADVLMPEELDAYDEVPDE